VCFGNGTCDDGIGGGGLCTCGAGFGGLACACGDGAIQAGEGEACDDGNATAGDGCDETCANLEFGYACDTPGAACTVTCGDGKKADGTLAEACDDNNTNPNDGCAADCTIESGYGCTGNDPSVCVSVCGDGSKAFNEGCDDSNTVSGDGCDSGCNPEFGFNCSGTAPSVCLSVCGDGKKASNEQCDDAANDAGDGCSVTCTIESGFTCLGNNATVCTASCGTVFDLNADAQEWVIVGDGAADFAQGASTFGGGSGLETNLNGNLPTAQAVDTHIKRLVAIPALGATIPAPALAVKYKLQGDVGDDCMRVYVNADGDFTNEVFSDCTDSDATEVIDLTALQGTTRFVVIRFVRATGATAQPGLFIDSVSIRSDIDEDALFEHDTQANCDGCIDVDQDGYGAAASVNDATCANGGADDCQDGVSAINPAAIELCDSAVDENCNGDLDTADAQCIEDCANGVDDGGNSIADCDDVICANDPFCNPCTIDYSFDTGPGTWTTDGLFEHLLTDGFWKTAGDGELVGDVQHTGRINLQVAVPTVAAGGPQPRLEVVYKLQGEPNPAFDVLAVCIDDTDCNGNTPTNVFKTGVNTAPPTAPAGNASNFNDGEFDHIFVDLTANAGSTIDVTLLFDTISTGNNDGLEGLTITQVRLASDVDQDGAYEGTAGTCDQCWDGDFDNYSHELSPGVAAATCPNAPAFDCNDGQGQINPGAAEVCNLPADEDCDGLINGLDDDCGTEDCANGVDDNGDNVVDCLDQTCAADPFCGVCAQQFTFNKGGGGWLAADNDPDGVALTQVFEYGTSANDGGAKGFSTVRDGLVSSANTTAKPFVKAWLSRTLAIPAGMPSPAVELRYSLDGDAADTQDIFGVCFDVVPTQCNAASAAFTTTTSSAALTKAIVPIDAAKAGSSISVVIFYDTVNTDSNDNNGLFVSDVILRSDIDDDGVFENADASCDHCVDTDGDGHGSPDVAASFVSDCANTPVDCNDDDENTKPGQAENCAVPGDQNCNDLVDIQELSCSVCGDGAVGAGEQCDDNNTDPGDGCSDSCQLESGALHITEIHLTKIGANSPGEQWFEIYNSSTATIDLTQLNLVFKNQSGLTQSFKDDCAPLAGKSTAIAASSFYVIGLGPNSTSDGLPADAECSGVFQLTEAGDTLLLQSGGSVLDLVAFSGYGCELGADLSGGQSRSMELIDAVSQDAASNDTDTAWCLAAGAASYSTSGKHFGSPGSAGACAELACDGLDDDCDGVTDESLTDSDIDGVCDEQDCDKDVATCTTDCDTDVDVDGTPDCKDGCLDFDGDGWGTPGGAQVATCKQLAGQDVPDCEDKLSFANPEADESPANAGSCANGVDDNCDGQLDCTDASCSGTSECEGESCAGATAVACGELKTVEPLTNSFPCGDGADAVLVFSPDVSETVSIVVGNEGDKQYAASVFTGSCTDLSCSGAAATVTSQCVKAGEGDLAVTAGQQYFVIVDQVADCSGAGTSAGTVRIVCGEVCDSGDDEDGDGAADCLDSDCVLDANCLAEDFDSDGVSNGDEDTCGTDPLDDGKTPTTDDLLNIDNDADINCVDADDDDDGFSDVDEAGQCPLNSSAKNDALINPNADKNCDKANVDADCNGKFDTLEGTCGAKEQQCGDGKDNDVDGKVDCVDTDCVSSSVCSELDFDLDGVNNGVELQCNFNALDPNSTPGPALAGDIDSDGVPNCTDADDDGDTVPDLEELLCGSDPADGASVPANFDSDTQCDAVDPDDDNDGAEDAKEKDCGSDPLDPASTPTDAVSDIDQDGICNAEDPDVDGDGWTNGVEEACGTDFADGSHNPTDLGLDGDGDKVCDALDPDNDDDGWNDDKESLCGTDKNDPTSVPEDADGDGKCDALDKDADDDGWADATEEDCGTDPLVAADNPDVNGDNPDGDELCNKLDDDDDGDGWSDSQESECGTDSLDESSMPVDTDSDQLCNPKDDDDDGDGALDSTELSCDSDPLDNTDVPADADGDGLCDTVDPDADPDADTWSNFDEEQCETDPKDAASVPTDTDSDGECDGLDDDDDGDGWIDLDEAACGTEPLDAALHPLDKDQDGTCDALDTDDDGDGSPDEDELLCGTDPQDATDQPLEIDLVDTDGDDTANCVDDDDDGDLITDALEAQLGSDPLKKDTDGDGLDDGEEDANQDGVVADDETDPTKTDTDLDGLDDGEEAELGTKGYNPDTDGDTLLDGAANEPDPLNADTDGDNFDDGTEVKCATDPTDAASVPVDKDGNEICDGSEIDSDGDGVADGVETFCGFDPKSNESTPSFSDLDDEPDPDVDDDINCVDNDDDGDDVSDEDELECGTFPRDPASKPTLEEIGDYDQDGKLNCSDPDDDNDGLSDADEELKGTDPKDKDSDDDGLSDGQEVNVFGTDPMDADTDEDGVQDGTELGETEGTGADTDTAVFVPDADDKTVTDPKTKDTDGDGVKDGGEDGEDTNSNGRVDDGEGNPLSPSDGLFDTDGDGLTDREEAQAGTDPNKPDTDDDGLDDKLEVLVYETNPLEPDSDGGGVVDGVEVANGTNPREGHADDDFTVGSLRGDNVFGCSAADQGRMPAGGVVVFLLLVLVALRRPRARMGLLVLVMMCTATPQAWSQARTSVGNVNVERFFPQGGRHRVWSVEASQTGVKWQPYASLTFYTERESLKFDYGAAEPELLVDHMTLMDLNIGVGLWDFLQLEMALPIALQMESGPDTQAIAPITEGAGIGDLVLRLRGSILRNRLGGFGIGATLGASFPSGDGDKFRGDEGVNVLVNTIFDYVTSRVLLSFNTGMRLRTVSSAFLTQEFGSELTYGLGIDVAVWPGRIQLAGEFFGHTPLSDPFASTDSTSLEFLAGPKVWIVEGLALQAAVGAGLVQGYGTPDFRFVTGLTWAPRAEDTDGDGIPDSADICPLGPEDKDGYSDRDGCPDLDNDNDGLLDGDDKCPNAAEDLNGLDDEDGCPDGDADGDKVADAADRCPNDREDMDGFADGDGCPDPDNDSDGFQDGEDKCPNQPETRNGYQDDDGCPDQAPNNTVVNAPKVDSECDWRIKERIFFAKNRSELKPGADEVVARVAELIKGNPLLLEVSVDGHASEEGGDVENLALSRKRARVIRDLLLKAGVTRKLLAARGFGEATPLVDGQTEAAFRKNRRVDFKVTLGGKCQK